MNKKSSYIKKRKRKKSLLVVNRCIFTAKSREREKRKGSRAYYSIKIVMRKLKCRVEKGMFEKEGIGEGYS
jgi:hypothetical protein